ncbi:MAG: nuclear transport factor 2 family protein [Acidimicrobiia bacterium]
METNRNQDIDARLAKLEAHEEIRQLAARYALALDSRAVATMVSLFVDDVAVGDGRWGATRSQSGSTRSCDRTELETVPVERAGEAAFDRGPRLPPEVDRGTAGIQ